MDSPADLYFGGAIAAFTAPWYCRTALALLGTWGRQRMIHSNKLDPSDSLSGPRSGNVRFRAIDDRFCVGSGHRGGGLRRPFTTQSRHSEALVGTHVWAKSPTPITTIIWFCIYTAYVVYLVAFALQ